MLLHPFVHFVIVFHEKSHSTIEFAGAISDVSFAMLRIFIFTNWSVAHTTIRSIVSTVI
jgi:hypothetical protein